MATINRALGDVNIFFLRKMAQSIVVLAYVVIRDFFFVIPFYLQSVLVHSENCVKTRIVIHNADDYYMTLKTVTKTCQTKIFAA
jgi:hypothetical protein